MKFKLVVAAVILLIFAGAANYYIGTVNNCKPVNERLISSEFWVDVATYQKVGSSNKSIIIVPPTGGVNLIDESYAKMFCSAGYKVFILKAWLEQNEESIELTLHQKFYTRSQKAIDLVVNEIKAGSIGIIGTSVGALHTSVALHLNERINAAFLIVGGAPLASVIVQSDQKAMRVLAEKRKTKYAFKNDEEYLKALSQEIKLEPMQLGDGYKNKKIAMLVALKDTTVPTELQINLSNYLKPSLLIQVEYTHFWAIIYAWLFKSDVILNFFDNEFDS